MNTVMERLGSVKYMEFWTTLQLTVSVSSRVSLYRTSYVSLLLISLVRPTSHTVRHRCRLSVFFLLYRGPSKFWWLRPISMNAIIFWLSFVVLVFLTLIFLSADNKVPIQPKPVCVCVFVCVYVCARN